MDMMPLETALPLVASAFEEGSAAVHQRVIGSSHGMAALYSVVFHRQAEFHDRASQQQASIVLEWHRDVSVTGMITPWYAWDRKTRELALQFRKELPWYERALDLVAKRERLASLVTEEILHAFGSAIPALATDVVLTKLADAARLACTQHLAASATPHSRARPPTEPRSGRSATATSTDHTHGQPKSKLSKQTLAQAAIQEIWNECGTEVLTWKLDELTRAIRNKGVDCQRGTVCKTTWWLEERRKLRSANAAAQADRARRGNE